MDIYKAIRALYDERKRLDELIASLEDLEERGDLEPVRISGKRRGRKSMSRQERLQVSERMRRYWAQRRKQAEQEAQPQP